MTNLAIWLIMEHRGHRQDWLAKQLGVSETYISRLKSGERQWTDELMNRAAEVLMLPRAVLFLSILLSGDS